MSNESTIVTEPDMESSAAAATAEDRGVPEENKIVPIMPAAPVPPASETAPEPKPAAKASDTAAAAREAAFAGEADHAPVPPVQEASAESPEEKPQPGRTAESRSYREELDDFIFEDEERPKKSFFHFRSYNEEESRDKLILSRIKDEDLMEYLALEQRRLEFLQQSKELKQKRILTAFQLLVSLAAIVAVTYLLKDNPTILISILYIVGIIAALNIWKNPSGKDKNRGRR